MESKLKDREKQILELLYEKDNISITQLCETFNVTVVTIRKDLDRLEASGLIVRTHGGASPLYNKELMCRKKENLEQKLAIAKEAAEKINDGDKVMITAGTTTSLIPKFLYNKRGIHIVTNSTLLLTYSRVNPNIRVTLLGGEFSAENESVSGSITLKEIEMFYTDKSFIGCDGFSVRNDSISANNTELAEVCRMIIARSNEVYVLADSTKYDKTGFAYIDKLSNINTLITDTSFNKENKGIIRDMKIDLINIK